MDHPEPSRPTLGVRDGLSYALFLPEERPTVGVVVLHGAGSAKESHFGFARAAQTLGMAALCFDMRGHGRSEGRFGPTAFADVLIMADVLREHAPAIALRGSSMGGFCAIQAAAIEPTTAAVVAICPAPEDFLLRGLREGRFEFEVDERPTEMWLESLSTRRAVASLAGRTALLLLHAKGDEQVPYAVSEELHGHAGEPKRLLLLPGGHHRSVQHDPELQEVSLRFIARAVARRAA
ncbi:MAG: alpha/beta fold hydrolase [Thermoleophilaceae bacterium]